MTYRSVILARSPKAKQMAAAIEAKSNELALEGYELVTMSITGSAKAILVFRREENMTGNQETAAQETADTALGVEASCSPSENGQQ